MMAGPMLHNKSLELTDRVRHEAARVAVVL
jgi:hypothetical protein